MERTPSKPIERRTVRARTPSVSESMKPPSSLNSPLRRSGLPPSTPVRTVVSTAPKTAPRSRTRTSLMLTNQEKQKFQMALNNEAENGDGGGSAFVTYITESLLSKMAGNGNLKDLKLLRISESDAKVKYIENLDLVPNLTELDLSDNQISQIRNLSHLKKLQILNLNTNMITIIEGLDTLTKLEELDLSGNRIERIPSSFKALVSLKTLKLHNNKLSTLRDLSTLRQMKNLNSLTIFQNPMSEVEHSRLYAIYQLPGISRLDDSEIDDLERDSAKIRFDREEIEQLESELATCKAQLKAAHDELDQMKKDSGSLKSNAGKLGKDLTSLHNRIEQLELESNAKTELLNKKSSELVGLCELLYEMKQELAFANIDKQFDMSAVDSILEGDSMKNQDKLFENDEDFDAEMLNALEDEDFFSLTGRSTPMSRPTGVMSPAISLGISNSGADSGIAQEFREMAYIGKTSATPNRTRSRNGSRAPNGPIKQTDMYAANRNNSEIQQAAHRFKTLQKQEVGIQSEIDALNQTLQQEMDKLNQMKSSLESKKRFVEENPDSPECFALMIEIETLQQEIQAQESTIALLERKADELKSRLQNNRTEAEQMKALLGDMDMDSINEAYDLSMEIKALEAQLEDREEELERLRNVLKKHNLQSEFDSTVMLREKSTSSIHYNDNISNSTHTHSTEVLTPDLMKLLREMEEAHISQVRTLIRGFPKYQTEARHWETEPSSVDEACHTLQQQITDAFGFGYSGTALTESVASLKQTIKELEAKNEYLDALKFTRFFNTEDGMIDLDAEAVVNGLQNVDVESYENQFKKDEETYESEKMVVEAEGNMKVERMKPGSGISHGVYREKLGKALSKQIWFLWMLLAKKMDVIRSLWEEGAIEKTTMKEMTETGEWKYWTGMGRMQYFFQHAMSQISDLNAQIEKRRSELSDEDRNRQVSVQFLAQEYERLTAEVDKVSTELATQKVTAHCLREEIEELEVKSVELPRIKQEIEQFEKLFNESKSQADSARAELTTVQSELHEATIVREKINAMKTELAQLETQVVQANQARQDLEKLKKEQTQILQKINPTKEELAILSREKELLQEQISRSKLILASMNQPAQTKAPVTSPSNESIKVTSTTSTETRPTIVSSASSESANSEIPKTDVPPVSERLSIYRQREQEARKKQEEVENKSNSSRTAPKRSWTVAESVGLARPKTEASTPTKTDPKASESIKASSSTQNVIEEPQFSDSLSKSEKRRSQMLPKGLQEFLNQTQK